MKTILAMLVVLLARPYYVTAEDVCGPQPDLRASVPYVLAEPNGLDPVIAAAFPILPPVRTDTLPPGPNEAMWHRPIGKLNRTGPYCVEPGWVLKELRCLPEASSSPGSVTWDSQTKTWTLAASVRRGVNYWTVHAVQLLSEDESVRTETTVLVTAWGDVPASGGVRLF